jgi:alpha-D-ribose 1-methylphosphonate 5-triphosphate synthase subunit PhnG
MIAGQPREELRVMPNNEMIDNRRLPCAGKRRPDWMGLLARADAQRLRERMATLGALPSHTLLRKPEQGLVMVRGRAGAIGAPFNLGEMTVTRCSVRLDDGTIGHAYVAGRDPEKAQNAAVLDAMLVRGGDLADRIDEHVLEPLARAEMERRATAMRRTAATRVDFFTMVRSEHGGRD